MIYPLLRKELREHGVLVLGALLLVGLMLYGQQSNLGAQVGRFSALRSFAMLSTPLLAFFLAGRLFLREYTGRTQLFLEILPTTRARVFATKWLLGLGLIELVTAAAWWIVQAEIRAVEVLSLRAGLTTLGCLALYTACVWSFAALAGTLGRYRFVAWLALLVPLVVATRQLGREWTELPVLRLLGEDVIMATGFPGWAPVWIAGAVAAAGLAGSALLTLAGSGAIAATLAQAMTARERVVVIISVLALMSLSPLLQNPEKPLFELVAGQVVQGERVQVAVLETADLPAEAATELAGWIAEDVDALLDVLALDPEVRVSITPRRGLDRTAVRRAALGSRDGIVLEAAPDAPRALLRAHVLHSVLLDVTLDRALREDRHVLLDGLSAHWSLRDDPAARALWHLRAAALPDPVTEASLTQWDATSEQLGDCLAFALALGVAESLEREVGHAAFLELMRSVFVEPATHVGVLLEQSPAAALREAGIEWSALAERVASDLQAMRLERAAELARRPEVQARILASRTRELGATVETEVLGAERYWVLYSELGPWTVYVHRPPRLDVRGSKAVLPIAPPPGARLWVAVELDDPILDCPVRVASRRIRVP